MTLDEARAYLTNLTTQMEDSVEGVVVNATAVQEAIYQLLQAELSEFDVTNGRLDPKQPIARKIMGIQKRIDSVLAERYNPAIADYLQAYDIVDNGITTLHREVNKINIGDSDIKNIRATVYEQAKLFLTDAVGDAYVQPIKFMLMQTITEGRTIKQAQSMLKNWNDGELTTGKLATGRATPRLQAYAGQMARDSLFQYNGTIQDNIGQRYNLTKFIYVGGLVKESRPFCKHLVGLKRKIDISEVPQLLEKYPQGIIKGTTKQNFPVYRGGTNCLHNVMMVR